MRKEITPKEVQHAKDAGQLTAKPHEQMPHPRAQIDAFVSFVCMPIEDRCVLVPASESSPAENFSDLDAFMNIPIEDVDRELREMGANPKDVRDRAEENFRRIQHCQ